jgi:hypothetical protein
MAGSHGDRAEAERLADELLAAFREQPLASLREQALIGKGAPGPLVFERPSSRQGTRYWCTVSLASIPEKHKHLLMVGVSMAPDDVVLREQSRPRRLVALTRRYGLLWMRPVQRVAELPNLDRA